MDRAADNIIRLPEVKRRTGLSRTTIYAKIADGSFPPQFKISANCAGWYESEVSAWVADPMAWERRAA
ncbi:AlpA family phage regulatory protein [Sphingomonas solaris]|uniref:AlpA family phage regulatory protein n=1 Tax=Alterirhizorhabdus solaris TaxID=2529389 RepID=A0A558R872_9SPHN|nr:AlpA family phage regulatory protein [Sphingomonas solaris]